jgi:hypothetical protein
MLHDDVLTRITQRTQYPINMGFGNQCAGRTCRDALPAIDTTRHIQTGIESRSDDCFGTSVDEINAGDMLNFFTNPDALSAFDAFSGIADNGFAGRINRISASLTDIPPLPDTEGFRKFAEFAVPIPLAEKTVVWMIGKEQFNDGSPGGNDAVGMGFDFHTGSDRKSATGNECALPFDFDHTDTASTGRRQSFIAAQSRHINSDSAQGGEQGFALNGIHLTAIDFDFDGNGHIDIFCGFQATGDRHRKSLWTAASLTL